MTTNIYVKQLGGFLGWFALTFCAAFTGSAASIQAKTFYAQLTQPDWAPPAWVFAPVWTSLFIMMALAAWLVWRQGGWRSHRNVLTLFVVQLMLNALWSWLFFGWHQGAAAFIEVLILWCTIAATMIGFWRVNKLAGALLVPYILWVSFAAMLNYTVWQLNPLLL